MKELNNEFKTWLKTLGFAECSVESLPRYTNEMLLHLEQNTITEANQITATAIQDYFFQWKNRKNKRTGAGLSQNYISKGITAINNFIKFLKVTGKNHISLKLQSEKIEFKIPPVLTQAEIQALYEATYTNIKTPYGQRDRAMLAVYYGCGLRKSEGGNLLVSDVLKDKKILFVRKGKGNKERFVPITEKAMQDIQEYLNGGRKWFLEQRQKKSKPKSDYFFINTDGNPMKDFSAKMKQLKEEAGITKQGNLHILRHSIATHLLQSGMDIEQIKKFLGHASLESTQIYTHIINEL